MPTKKKRVRRTPVVENKVALYDVNVCGPEYFEVKLDAPLSAKGEFVTRLAAYCDTMFSLDRVVMVGRDEDRIYLSSIEQSPKL